MKKFEYKVIEINRTIKNNEFEKQMNDLGKEGWELIFTPSLTLVYIFKREI